MTEQEKQRLEILENFMADFVYSDRYISQKHLQILDGKNIQLARGTGTKIGTATDQKLGFYGETPTAQQATIPYPVGGATVDTEARQAINSIITALQNLGLIA